MDYKETLLLPKTSFAMRGNLAANEPKRYEKWQNEDVYSKMKKSRAGAETFTLHDGPPYANGHLHIGHALNKILKDMIVKFNYFNGKDVRFTIGWDCHGLPIEQQIEKKLGGKDSKDELGVSEVRRLCREYAKEFVQIQKEEFKTFGVIADYANSYLSMDYKFEANIYKLLCDMALKGYLVERSKPVYWSWAERTALAEAEIEYKDKVSPSIYVAFKLKDGEYNGKSLIIWTTTPWTLPANVAIAIGKDIEYISTTDGYIVAKGLHSTLLNEGVLTGDIDSPIVNDQLEGSHAINPLNERDSLVIYGDHVDSSGGTGCVHTAPGHGEDDYFVSLKYNLEVLMPVDEFGHYSELAIKKGLFPKSLKDELNGMFIFKANRVIIEYLVANGSMLKHTEITHSYPHCWRSKKPVIFRATRQWFISMDNEKKLRNSSLNALQNVTFYPAKAKNRLTSAVSNRPDWCISRQRSWGVPIAFLRDKVTKEPLLDESVLKHIEKIFSENGSDVWYSYSIDKLLPSGSKYDHTKLEKVGDILDVWFDSGSTWLSVLSSGNYDAGKMPADLYLEGSDQHRGWFQSSLLLSSAINGVAPYKSVITHGFTVDAKGEKMSKSKGNVIAPEKVIKQYGSEVLRLWVALSDYSGDLKVSNEILKQTGESYKKIRNTFRFLLANTDDLATLCTVNDLNSLERWIYHEAKSVFDEVHSCFSSYDFSKGLNSLNNFLVNDLSGIYLDICKDRLYCDSINSTIRNSSQSAMLYMLDSLLSLIAPILTYTVDEVIENSNKILHSKYDSVFDMVYKPLDTISDIGFDYELYKDARAEFLLIVDDLKKNAGLKNTLELNIYSDSDKCKKLSKRDCEDWFLVSNFSSDGKLIKEFSVSGVTFKVSYSNLAKCERCWKLSVTEGEICERCKKVVDEL